MQRTWYCVEKNNPVVENSSQHRHIHIDITYICIYIYIYIVSYLFTYLLICLSIFPYLFTHVWIYTHLNLSIYICSKRCMYLHARYFHNQYCSNIPTSICMALSLSPASCPRTSLRGCFWRCRRSRAKEVWKRAVVLVVVGLLVLGLVVWQS